MSSHKGITRFGWLIAGLILAYSGIRHMITQQLFGKIHMMDSVPSQEGWPVLALGLLELIAGIFFIIRFVRNYGRN